MNTNRAEEHSMFAFVARQPILDSHKEVYAYELLFRDGPGGSLPAESAELAEANHLSLSLDDISCQKTAFVNIEADTLINRFPANLDPKNVVVELTGGCQINQRLVEACQHVRMLGFQLALDAPQLETNLDPLLPYLDIVKVDVTRQQIQSIEQQLAKLRDARLTLVAEQVQTQKDFSICLDLGFDYFQGYFFCKPESLKGSPLPANKATLVELMSESASTEFDVDRISGILERDAALSYMLLRFINNPTVNKRYKIESLRHALNYMGEVEIKKFIALLSLANLSDNKPMELIHLSLVRAKFCDLLAQHMKLGDNPPSGFLVGLFSMLDGLLDQTMEEALQQVPLTDDIKTALLGKHNRLGQYLELARGFESANWLAVRRLCNELSLQQQQAHHLFNQAIMWGNGMRQSISPYFPSRQRV